MQKQDHTVELSYARKLIEPEKIPEWQKEIVRKRVANSKDSDFTELDEAFKNLRLE